MIIPTIRLIVPDIGVAQKQIEELAAKEGWARTGVTEKTDTTNFEIEWAHLPTNTSIHYIEDDFVGLDYIKVLGERYEEVASLIRKHVKITPRSEIIDYAKKAKTDEELAVAVNGVIGVASSKFDPELFEIIKRAASSNDTQTRYEALITIGYVEWEECKDILVHFAKNDPNDGMRQKASGLLETLQEFWEDPVSYD